MAHSANQSIQQFFIIICGAIVENSVHHARDGKDGRVRVIPADIVSIGKAFRKATPESIANIVTYMVLLVICALFSIVRHVAHYVFDTIINICRAIGWYYSEMQLEQDAHFGGLLKLLRGMATIILLAVLVLLAQVLPLFDLGCRAVEFARKSTLTLHSDPMQFKPKIIHDNTLPNVHPAPQSIDVGVQTDSSWKQVLARVAPTVAAQDVHGKIVNQAAVGPASRFEFLNTLIAPIGIDAATSPRAPISVDASNSPRVSAMIDASTSPRASFSLDGLSLLSSPISLTSPVSSQPNSSGVDTQDVAIDASLDVRAPILPEAWNASTGDDASILESERETALPVDHEEPDSPQENPESLPEILNSPEIAMDSPTTASSRQALTGNNPAEGVPEEIHSSMESAAQLVHESPMPALATTPAIGHRPLQAMIDSFELLYRQQAVPDTLESNLQPIQTNSVQSMGMDTNSQLPPLNEIHWQWASMFNRQHSMQAGAVQQSSMPMELNSTLQFNFFNSQGNSLFPNEPMPVVPSQPLPMEATPWFSATPVQQMSMMEGIPSFFTTIQQAMPIIPDTPSPLAPPPAAESILLPMATTMGTEIPIVEAPQSLFMGNAQINVMNVPQQVPTIHTSQYPEAIVAMETQSTPLNGANQDEKASVLKKRHRDLSNGSNYDETTSNRCKAESSASESSLVETKTEELRPTQAASSAPTSNDEHVAPVLTNNKKSATLAERSRPLRRPFSLNDRLSAISPAFSASLEKVQRESAIPPSASPLMEAHPFFEDISSMAAASSPSQASTPTPQQVASANQPHQFVVDRRPVIDPELRMLFEEPESDAPPSASQPVVASASSESTHVPISFFAPLADASVAPRASASTSSTLSSLSVQEDGGRHSLNRKNRVVPEHQPLFAPIDALVPPMSQGFFSPSSQSSACKEKKLVRNNRPRIGPAFVHPSLRSINQELPTAAPRSSEASTMTYDPIERPLYNKALAASAAAASIAASAVAQGVMSDPFAHPYAASTSESSSSSSPATKFHGTKRHVPQEFPPDPTLQAGKGKKRPSEVQFHWDSSAEDLLPPPTDNRPEDTGQSWQEHVENIDQRIYESNDPYADIGRRPIKKKGPPKHNKLRRELGLAPKTYK
ncbi:hypothetical protein BC940DRAFT_357061 [Gongronella butleri]|nr:hypothetical protein BC940DRAFT_357061 [Gongronella butleri]